LRNTGATSTPDEPLLRGRRCECFVDNALDVAQAMHEQTTAMRRM
jgi:hypothetical protein